MGKSAIINRLFGAPMVGVSPTPGRTKHLQTHFLGPKVDPSRIISAGSNHLQTHLLGPKVDPSRIISAGPNHLQTHFLGPKVDPSRIISAGSRVRGVWT